MEVKEKMVQIYNLMADITIKSLEVIKNAKTIPDESDLSMVSATVQLYNFIADHHQSELFQ